MKLYAPTEEPKQPEQPIPPREEIPKPLSCRFKSWWYYYKWYVVCGIILLCILGNIIHGILTAERPDLQIAYVGKSNLPGDTAEALEQAFADLAEHTGWGERPLVKLNQYTLDFQSPGAASSNYASEMRLMGDLSACESYFFLAEDPEALQQAFQIFACPDGSAPEESDISARDKVVLWADCAALTDMELGSYTIPTGENEITGDSQELLSGLSFGRRYFVSGKEINSISQCNALWDFIAATENPQN